MLFTPEKLFQALSDPTRLRCLLLMTEEGELCVCELTYALALIQPKISRHLAMLREVGMVIDRRAGQWIYYQIRPDIPDWAKKILTATCEGAMDKEPYIIDRANLAQMPNRPGSRCCA